MKISLSKILKEATETIKEKVLWENKWFKIVEKTDKDGAQMSGIQPLLGNVVVVPYVKEGDKITKVGVMNEVNPLWGEGTHVTTVTGGVEEGEDNLEAAKRELKEESGYDVEDSDKWQFICEVKVSKIVDGVRLEIGEASKDGTINEELSSFELMDIEDAIYKCKDAYIPMMIYKLENEYF
jgi:8-oxo-dGTP pyrophosphatase MutT (NUDIX family)